MCGPCRQATRCSGEESETLWSEVTRRCWGRRAPRAQVLPYKKGGTLYGQASLVCLGQCPLLALGPSPRRAVEVQVSDSRSLCHADGHASGPGTLSYNRVKI